MREGLLAIALVGLAVMTLGTDWSGVEVSPGVWQDRVTGLQWALFAGAVLAMGVLAARVVAGWPRRLLLVTPALAWLLWQLSAGTLWPVAFAIYGTLVVACWLAGLLVGDRLPRRHRPA